MITEDPMPSNVSLRIAKDIQRRAHQDAAMDRRSRQASPETAPDHDTSNGQSWIVRLRSARHIRRRSTDPLEA
jgi:hypothetical protein